MKIFTNLSQLGAQQTAKKLQKSIEQKESEIYQLEDDSIINLFKVGLTDTQHCLKIFILLFHQMLKKVIFLWYGNAHYKRYFVAARNSVRFYLLRWLNSYT